MLCCLNLSLKRDNEYLFKNLSVTISNGAILAVVGPNGSGKTSLLRMIAGIQKYTGSIAYNHIEISSINKPFVNYIGHHPGVKMDLTVFENINFWSKIYRSNAMTDAAIAYWELEPILKQKCYTLSDGTIKKVAMTRLLACDSGIWILDEPESSLDDISAYKIGNLIRIKANSGNIVVLSTHQHENYEHKLFIKAFL